MENMQQESMESAQIVTTPSFINSTEKWFKKHLVGPTGEKTSQGSDIRVTRYSRKGRIAYEKLPGLQEMDLKQYRQESVEAWMVSEIA